ncbi:DnaB-like helicase N-terminal domain-containing protein [Streptomyces griseoluteus]|uniref:DnaB-like helicase N-terminal domain-containing protein n=1 Tax=Streptomyces griseoluteus TaxID=29306 RepID=UPI0036EEB516
MNPLLEAEQAVLGAVLLNPDQLPRLDWLAPDHFHRPVHQALFTSLRKLHSDGHPAVGTDEPAPPRGTRGAWPDRITVGGNTPVLRQWVTDAVDNAALHARGLTAAYAHTLISACPLPEHAPVYGRMVLEGAIHRTVAQHAIRLHQAARADALKGEVEGALRSADILTGVLTDLARRWGTEPRPVAPSAPPPTSAAVPPVQADLVAEDEHFLLAVLAEQPQALDEVVAWLRPGDFADPAHGQVYRCLGALHHRGEPIFLASTGAAPGPSPRARGPGSMSCRFTRAGELFLGLSLNPAFHDKVRHTGHFSHSAHAPTSHRQDHPNGLYGVPWGAERFCRIDALNCTARASRNPCRSSAA